MKPSVAIEDVYRIIYQEHQDPFDILGCHLIDLDGKKVVSIRAFLPRAVEAYVVSSQGKEYPMNRLHRAGFYEAICSDQNQPFLYQLKTKREDGSYTSFYDSYSFLPGFTDFDRYLFQQGRHHKTYEKLGSHLMQMNGIQGVYFAVWAPDAKAVSVIGSFNQWDRRLHMMRKLGSSGVWEIFIPGLGQGEIYKYQITTLYNLVFDKSDPYGFYHEVSPHTASVVWDIDQYVWQDQEWMKARSTQTYHNSPVSIYEMHLGSWQRDDKNNFYNYRQLAEQLVVYLKKMGYTHVELMPIMEHPFYGSWGYQCLGLFAPTSRYGTPEDFMYFVNTMHQNGIGVILDWVPAHFPTDNHGLAFFDGTHLYEHADPRQREHRDWNTFIYNYGRYEVKNFLITSALFWLDKYHIDGLRVDAVASMLYLDYSRKPGEWIPNKFGGRENLDAITFLQECNTLAKEYYLGVMMIAEESTAWPKVSWPTHLGGLGFTHKWNMGWMHDTLDYFQKDPVHRKYHHNQLTFSIWYAWCENFILALSHDEIVYGKGSILQKMPGDNWRKFANLRLLYGYMFAHPGKKLLFMGDDFGQWSEWYHETKLDWGLLQEEPHRKLQLYVAELNHFYRSHPALYERDNTPEGFEWIDFHDTDNSILAFYRKSVYEEIIFICNFTPIPRLDYKLGISQPGSYEEILNSDADIFGGSNMGNLGVAYTVASPWQNKPNTLVVQIPPLAIIALRRKIG